ncbi:MAG: hypothetical protein ACXIVE_16485 [Salinarimonas sp.]
MSLHITTELIWHFAGYLQIFKTVNAERPDFAGEAPPPPALAFDADPAEWIEAPPGDPADSLAAMRFNLSQGGPGAPFMSEWFAGRDFSAFMPFPIFFGPLMPIVMSVQGIATGALMLMSREAGPFYKITFGSGGDNRLIELAQSNALTDIDTLLAIDMLADTRISQDASTVLTQMMGEARDAMPQWASDLPGQGILFPAFLVAEAEAAFIAPEEAGSGEDAPAREGVFLNGDLIEADDAPESPLAKLSLANAMDPDGETGAEIQLMARPAPDATGTVAASGGNVLVNEAALIDALIPARTLAVMGDVFQRDAIMQINILGNNDLVAVNGAVQSAMASMAGGSGGDTLTNLAKVSHNPETLPTATGLNPNGLIVNVDIADHDIFDVKMLVQQNLADDGDRIYWGGTDAWSMMGFGGNIQANAARLLDLGKSYDLVIVMGSYYALNFVGQINILTDDDIVALFGPPGGAALDYRSEPNTLHNEARIDKRGEQNWTAMKPDAADLFAKLAAREDPGMEAFAGISGAATGKLDILVVTGDWYDVSVLWQVNMLADRDLVVMTGEEQGEVVTGGNMLVNNATIVDFGAFHAQYAGGEVYQDLMLFQANIAFDSGEPMIAQGNGEGDTQMLATEFIAFLDEELIHEDAVAPAPSVALQHEDAFGSVMV